MIVVARAGEDLESGDTVYLRETPQGFVAYKTPQAALNATETPTKDPATTPTAPAPKEPADDTPEHRRDPEERPSCGGAKPPADGLCRNCKRRRALNRFKLCYPCWVEAEIIDREKREGREWKPGDPHPAWCHCEGLGEHKNGDGTASGFN